MQRKIITVLLALLVGVLLAGCGNKSTDPSRTGRLDTSDSRSSSGRYFDTYTCDATITGGVSVDMSSSDFQCRFGVYQLLGDGSLSFVTSSDTGRGVTASWTAAKGETYVIVATSQNPGDTGDYSLTFHDLNNINTRAASHIVNKDEIDRFLELKKR